MTVAPPAAGAALELILRATLLVGLAWAAAASLRRTGASAAARHRAWQLGILALLALPIAWWLAPPLRLPILPPAQAVAAVAPPDASPLDVAPPAADGAAGWSLLLLLYLAGVVAVLLRIALSRHLVSRLWRDAEPEPDPDWQTLLADLSRETGLSRAVRLRIAREAAMPMTWGTLAPKLLLPVEARAWTGERRRLVLLHELAHVARRDSFGRSAASLACALYWFHPGIWFAARRLRLEQEHAADDRVLQAGARPKSYARSLLDLAYSPGDMRWPDHAAAMAGMNQLERRLVAITGSPRREVPGAIFHSASAAITVLTVLAVAASLPVRPLPPLSALPVAPALPAADAAAAPVERAAGPEVRLTERTTIRPRPDAGSQVPDIGAPDAQQMQVPTAQPVALAAQDLAPSPVQQSPPPAQVLGPIGPRLQPIPEERESDPRIPAALRQRHAGRDVDRRAGPGPPRNPGEGVMRSLPTALLQAAGVLPSN